MQLTVAIPTLNRAEWLETCLGKLEAVAAGLVAAGHGLDVLISDNASSDATPDVAARPRGYPVRVVRRAVQGEIYHSIATALLHGSTGDPDAAMILIGDDDELVLPGISIALDRLAADSSVIGVAGGLFGINIDTGTNATVQICLEDYLARLSFKNLTDFFKNENYLEIVVVRKSAYNYWNVYDGHGLPCHTRALVRFIKGGDLIWLPDTLIIKKFHRFNFSRKVLTDYQQVRIIQDRELAFSDMFLMGIHTSPDSLFGLTLSREYYSCSNLWPENPYLAIISAKRCLAFGWIPTQFNDLESAAILPAAVDAILYLSQISALPGPLLVPHLHPLAPLLLGHLKKFSQNHPSVTFGADLGPGTPGCLRLVVGKRDLAAVSGDNVPTVALEGVIDGLRLTRRPLLIEGV